MGNSHDDDKKVVYIKDKNNNGEKKIFVGADESLLIYDGEVINLDSFVISGKDVDNHSIVLTYNTSFEESLFYSGVLEVTLKDVLLNNLKNDQDLT